jgi:MFS transporter, DHA1 family, multidrug resistance protein
MACFAAVSILCAASNSADLLIALRLAQGVAGGFGMVIARAVVRDVYSKVEAASFFSSLMLAFGLGPILAPVIGGGLLLISDWHGIFLFLALLGALLSMSVLFYLPETLPAARRHSGGLRRALNDLRSLFADRDLLGYAIPAACAQAAMIAYVSASSFVFQDHFDLSAQLFAGIFALNSAGMIATSQIGRRLMRSVGAQNLLRVGFAVHLGAAAALLVGAVGGLGAFSVAIPCFALVSSLGLITPNAVALGLERHPEKAGAASGIFGLMQYLTSAAVAPVVGIAGASPIPMALVIATLSFAALVTRAFVPVHPAKMATI